MPFRRFNSVLRPVAAAPMPVAARLVLLIWLTGFCFSGAAQTAGELPILTNAAQVLELGIIPASRLRQPIRLTGVVTFQDVLRSRLFVQDDTAGILVIPKDTTHARIAGELVEVEGISAVGAFAGLAQGAQLTISAVQFEVSYPGGTGSDVVLTCINTAPSFTIPVDGAVGIHL